MLIVSFALTILKLNDDPPAVLTRRVMMPRATAPALIVSANRHRIIAVSRNGEVRQLQTYTSAGTVLITAQIES